MAALHHPHIVPIFAVGCDRGVHYYAMQLIAGCSLADRLRGTGDEPPVAGRGGAAGHAGGRGAGARARPGRPAPRHQAGQPAGRAGRAPLGHRLRPGPARGRRRPDGQRRRAGDPALHEPRAGGRRPGARPPHRRLLAGRDPLRAADGPARLRRHRPRRSCSAGSPTTSRSRRAGSTRRSRATWRRSSARRWPRSPSGATPRPASWPTTSAGSSTTGRSWPDGRARSERLGRWSRRHARATAAAAALLVAGGRGLGRRHGAALGRAAADARRAPRRPRRPGGTSARPCSSPSPPRTRSPAGPWRGSPRPPTRRTPPSSRATGTFCRAALGYYEEIAGRYRRDPEMPAIVAAAEHRIGFIRMILDEPGAEDAYRRSIALYERLLAAAPGDPRLRSELALTYSDLILLLRKDRPDGGGPRRASRRSWSCGAGWPTDVPDDAENLVSLTLLQAEYAGLLEQAGRAAEADRGPAAARAIYRLAIDREPRNPAPRNNLAWLLAGRPEAAPHDPARAVELAEQAVAMAPAAGAYWNTLGVAHYRAGDWAAAVDALEESMRLRSGGDPYDWLFLAMARQRLGDAAEARRWLDRSLAWIEAKAPRNRGADPIPRRGRCGSLGPETAPAPRQPGDGPTRVIGPTPRDRPASIPDVARLHSGAGPGLAVRPRPAGPAVQPAPAVRAGIGPAARSAPSSRGRSSTEVSHHESPDASPIRDRRRRARAGPGPDVLVRLAASRRPTGHLQRDTAAGSNDFVPFENDGTPNRPNGDHLGNQVTFAGGRPLPGSRAGRLRLDRPQGGRYLHAGPLQERRADRPEQRAEPAGHADRGVHDAGLEHPAAGQRRLRRRLVLPADPRPRLADRGGQLQLQHDDTRASSWGRSPPSRPR